MTRTRRRLRRMLALIDDPVLKAEIERELERLAILEREDHETVLTETQVQTGIVVDQPTAAGRTYPREALRRAVERYREQIDNRRAFGALFDQMDGRTRLVNVSHLVTDIQIDDAGNLMATVDILNTARGRALRSLMDANVPMRLSARGFGSLDANGRVGDDYRIAAFDVVPIDDPQDPGCDTIPFVIDDRQLDATIIREHRRPVHVVREVPDEEQ